MKGLGQGTFPFHKNTAFHGWSLDHMRHAWSAEANQRVHARLNRRRPLNISRTCLCVTRFLGATERGRVHNVSIQIGRYTDS